MKKSIPLSEMTQSQLRNRYYAHTRKAKSIPDDLNKRLGEVFKTYDPIRRVFTGPNVRNFVTKPVSELSLKGARHRFYEHKNNKEPIPDELNEYLGKICKTYDPIKRDFIGKSGRTIPLSKMNKHQLISKYHHHITKGKPISNAFNKRLAQMCPTYDPINKIFTGKPGKKRENYPLSAKTPEQLRDRYSYITTNGEQVPDDLNDMLADIYLDYNSDLRIFTKSQISPDAAANIVRRLDVNRINAPNFYVSIKKIRGFDTTQYLNVCINHRILIKNASMPTVQSIMDGLALLVHTTKTEQYPAQHILFNNAATQIISNQIRHISNTDDELYIYTNSGAMITIPKQKLLETTTSTKRFIIQQSKHR